MDESVADETPAEAVRKAGPFKGTVVERNGKIANTGGLLYVILTTLT